MVLKFSRILAVIAVLIALFIVFIICSFPFARGSVVVEPTGGLGNQMFQYSSAYSLAKKTNSKLYVVVSRKKSGKILSSGRNFPLGNFNIPGESIIYKDQISSWFIFKGIKLDGFLTKIANPFIRNKIASVVTSLNEGLKDFFDIEVFNEGNISNYRMKRNDKILFASDNFESEIYFEDVKAELLHEIFTYKYPVENSKILDLMAQVSKDNAVCVHVRRGDMVDLPEFFLPINYQNQAIELVKKKIEMPKFFIFSDSPEMVKEEITKVNSFSFIEGSAWDDFVVMSHCTNIIIANSTFSWWAAYLNQKKNHLVIAPYPRVNDIFLDSLFW